MDVVYLQGVQLLEWRGSNADLKFSLNPASPSSRVSVLPAILSQLCLSMLEGGDVLLSLREPPRASQITHKLAVKHTQT